MSSQAFSPYYQLASFELFYPVTFLYKLAASAVLWRAVPKALPAPMPTSSSSPEKVAIVTGSNAGIGYETAMCLATRYGYTVILATRSRDKGEQAADQIRSKGGNAVFLHLLDLSSLESVRQFARVVRQRYSTIHCLVNNAGINSNGVSDDHLDLLFQSNFLGHYLLTAELWDSFDKNNRARIVNVSSVMHHFCGKSDIESSAFWKRVANPPEGFDGENQHHDATKHYTYSLSKLAAILFSIELNRRFGDHVRSIAVNPGSV
jgi:NAD(P)-dependent dehydrogenase (short-subunit alcohol dehydrogenase family)